MTAIVSDIVTLLDRMAPPRLAEDWDNVGLQVGDPRQPVQSVWIALDPSLEVVQAACQENIDLLITHHPLIFRPLKSVDYQTPVGAIVKLAVKNHLAIVAAHTNLDSVAGGINDILARRIGIGDLKPLVTTDPLKRFKLVIYAPREIEDRIRASLLHHLGRLTEDPLRKAIRYDMIHWIGPLADESLQKSSTGEDAEGEGIRIDINVQKAELKDAIAALRRQHHNQRIYYDVYPLESDDPQHGIGRIGYLETRMDLKSFALMVKNKLDLNSVKYAGNPSLSITKAAVCSGSGASLLANFLASDAHVYVSGDLRYHDARDAEASDRGIIDIGHFSSEYIIVADLADRLKGMVAECHLDASVDACVLEKDPFIVI